MMWLTWGALIVLQSAAFTWVSRARNSSSVAYHAVASVFSNAIWIASMYFVVGQLQQPTLTRGLIVGAFYTGCAVTGASAMHWLSLRHFERGTRRVGA